MADEQRVLASFPRNAEETLQVSLSTFRGKTYVDIRLYFRDQEGNLRPTRKGVTVTPELWDEFRKAIALAEEALQQSHLWHPAEGE